jgi:hypothetical protein
LCRIRTSVFFLVGVTFVHYWYRHSAQDPKPI